MKREAAAEAIRKAVESGDINSLHSLLSRASSNQVQIKTKTGWETALHLAIRLEKTEIADFLLKNGYKPDQLDSRGLTATAVAAETNAFREIELLALAGGNLMQRITWKEFKGTPLVNFAIGMGSADVASSIISLLSEGQDGKLPLIKDWVAYVMQPDGEGWTGLHFAAAAGDKENGKMMLEEGANPLVQDTLGRIPLHLACANGAEWMAGLLSSPKSVGVNSLDHKGRSPLDYIAEHEPLAGADEKEYYAKIRMMLLKKGGKYAVHAQLQPARSPIYDMIVRNAHRKLATALAKGADPNARIEDGYGTYTTPLNAAILRKRQNIIEILLQSGADIDLSGPDGLTPLVTALEMRWEDREIAEEIALLLLERGADIEKRVTQVGDYNPYWPFVEQTPLLRAIATHKLRAIEDLLRRGADPHAIDGHGRNVIFQLMTWSDPSMLKRFLAIGVNAKLRDADGNTPLSFSSYYMSRSTEVVKILLEAGVDPSIPHYEPDNTWRTAGTYPLLECALHTSECGHAGRSVFLVLLPLVDVNEKTSEGTAPIHSAARWWWPELVEKLLARGADCNIANRDLDTPLHIAAHHGNHDLFSLLANPSTINAKNKKGQTPLDILIEECPGRGDEWKNYHEAVPILKALGGKRSRELSTT